MSVVIDASVAIAWSFEDEHTASILALARRVAEEGAWAPAHLKLEYASALVGAARRGRATPAKVRSSLVAIDGVDIGIDDLCAHTALSPCVDLADKHGLTIYDAAYLELALRLGAELATLDEDLAAASRAESVALVDLAG